MQEQERWRRKALERLSASDLRALERALQREVDLPGETFPQGELDLKEQAAFDRFLRYYEEAKNHAS